MSYVVEFSLPENSQDVVDIIRTNMSISIIFNLQVPGEQECDSMAYGCYKKFDNILIQIRNVEHAISIGDWYENHLIALKVSANAAKRKYIKILSKTMPYRGARKCAVDVVRYRLNRCII